MLGLLGLDTLGAVLVGLAAAIVGGFVAYLRGRSQGRAAANQKATEEDHENAADIRARVARDRAAELRKHDDAGYRD